MLYEEWSIMIMERCYCFVNAQFHDPTLDNTLHCTTCVFVILTNAPSHVF